jgi:hypothetical protein
LERYIEHNRAIREHFRERPEQFLEMDIVGGDGWGKLCPFLDKMSPDVPFPSANRTNRHRSELPTLSRPDFLCVGLQKAGTGWLHDQISHHSDFWMPPIKEIHYFDSPQKKFYHKFGRCQPWRGVLSRFQALPLKKRLVAAGRWPLDHRDKSFLWHAWKLAHCEFPEWQGYGQLFASRGTRLSGDITPAYSTLDDDAVASLARHFPDLKIIILVRDPVERLWSQYCMWLRKSKIPDLRDADSVLAFAARPDVRARSFPSQILRRWQRFFPDGQIGVFFFDVLQSDPATLRAEILEFLGADPAKSSHVPADRNRKAHLLKIDCTPSLRDALARYFHNELLACAEVLGGPALGWPARYGL